MLPRAAATLSRRLLHTDAHYHAWVMTLADILKDGKYSRAMLMDAVLLAEELNDERQYKELLRTSPTMKG